MLKKWVLTTMACLLLATSGATAGAAGNPAAGNPGETPASADNRSVDSRIQEAIETFLQSAPATSAPVLNVKSAAFGAVGDGVADDTAAIQKALDQAKAQGGAVVYLPEGTYKTSKNLYVYSKTKVTGHAAKVSKIDTDDGYAVFEIAADQREVVIDGLWIDNNKSSGNIGVDFQTNVSNVWITNNTFTGIHSQSVNINATGVKHIQVSGNRFEEVAYGVLTNLLATDVSDVRVVNNAFIHIHGDAIELNHPGEAYASGTNFVIAGNYMSVPPGYGDSGGAGFGIGIAGATHVTIIGNVIEDARYEAIHIEDEAKHITIVGNVINGVEAEPDFNLNSGVYVIDGDYITVSGNAIRGAADYGVHFEYAPDREATNAVVTGNTITGGGQGGIRIAGYTGNSNIVVSQNVVTGNAGNGIQLAGDLRNVKVTDNVVKDNTGYGLFLENSGRGWYLSGNSFYGNGTGDIGFGSGYKVPVPIRDQTALFDQTVQVVQGDEASRYTAWQDAFTLGSGAEGTLYVSAVRGGARSTKIYRISWDGATLTAVQVAHDIEGAIEVDAPRMNGKKLQIRSYNLASGDVQTEVQFEGLILLK